MALRLSASGYIDGPICVDDTYSIGRIEAIERALSRSWAKIALDVELEAEYQDRTERKRRITIAGWLCVTVLANLSTLPLDYMVGQFQLGLTLRLGVATPIYFLAVLVLLRGPERAQGVAVVLPLVTFVSVVAFLGLQVGPPHSDRYLMAIGLMLLFNTIVVPTSFRHAVKAILFSALALFALAYVEKGPDANTLSLCAFITVGSILPLIVRFRAEKTSRDAFLVQLRDELKSAQLLALTKALGELADTDPLTGLRNRRSLSETLNREWSEACARSDWFGILMIDIDRFKLFNDTAGHDAGDRCLEQVALALQSETVRHGHYVARFGGEEFTTIISGLPPTAALQIAEALRRAVEDLAMPHPGYSDGTVVTVSIGAAVLQPSGHETAQEVIDAADRALYKAKANGRNCVVSSASMAGYIVRMKA